MEKVEKARRAARSTLPARSRFLRAPRFLRPPRFLRAPRFLRTAVRQSCTQPIGAQSAPTSALLPLCLCARLASLLTHQEKSQRDRYCALWLRHMALKRNLATDIVSISLIGDSSTSWLMSTPTRITRSTTSQITGARLTAERVTLNNRLCPLCPNRLLRLPYGGAAIIRQ